MTLTLSLEDCKAFLNCTNRLIADRYDKLRKLNDDIMLLENVQSSIKEQIAAQSTEDKIP